MYEIANATIAAVVVGLAAVFATAVVAGAGAESALCAAYAYSPALGAGVHSLTAPIRPRLDR